MADNRYFQKQNSLDNSRGSQNSLGRQMFCPNCGMQIPNGIDVCPQCGWIIFGYNSNQRDQYRNIGQQENINGYNNPNNNDKKTNNIIPIFIFAFLGVFIGVCVIFSIMYFEHAFDSDDSVTESISDTVEEKTTEELLYSTTERAEHEKTESDSDVVVEETTEETTEVTTEEITEATTEETTEEITEVTTEAVADSSERYLFDAMYKLSFIVPAGFDTVTNETAALQYVYKFYNSRLDMHITVISTMRNNIPMTLEDDYNWQLKNYDIVYNEYHDKWYAVSGYDNAGYVHYYKANIDHDDSQGHYFALDINYPNDSRKSECDDILSDFVNSVDYPD